MTVFKWSQTASDNDDADSTINLRENQAPLTYNNAVRAAMAAVRKWWDDLSGNVVTAGTSTAITIASNQVFTSLIDGIHVRARITTTSGATPTLAVDDLTAKAIQLLSGTAIPTGALVAGSIHGFTYDSSADAWIVHGLVGASKYVGEVFDFAGASAPALSLLCYGQAVSRTTYAALFAVIGTTYGEGDAATTFNVPDLRGRVVAGQDDMGGSSANRLTDQTGGLDGDTLGATGGSETHTLLEAQLASHTHSFSATTSSDGTHGHPARYAVAADNDGYSEGGIMLNIVGDQNFAAFTGTPSATAGEQIGGAGAHTHTVSGTSGSTGSGTAHNNVQPTIILNKCIFAGA